MLSGVHQEFFQMEANTILKHVSTELRDAVLETFGKNVQRGDKIFDLKYEEISGMKDPFKRRLSRVALLKSDQVQLILQQIKQKTKKMMKEVVCVQKSINDRVADSN